MSFNLGRLAARLSLGQFKSPMSPHSIFFCNSLGSFCVSSLRRLGSTGAFSGIHGVEKAHSLLGLPSKFSARDLRKSYLMASKKLHPDVSTLDKDAATKLFLEMTEAYEILQDLLLQAKAHTDAGGDMHDFQSSNSRGDRMNDEDLLMSEEEEEEWREMCRLWVGTSAEHVEELKADPAWRLWLMGDTDGAGHWRTFLLNNGGLMPIYLRGQQHQLSGKRQLRLGKKPRRKRK